MKLTHQLSMDINQIGTNNVFKNSASEQCILARSGFTKYLSSTNNTSIAPHKHKKIASISPQLNSDLIEKLNAVSDAKVDSLFLTRQFTSVPSSPTLFDGSKSDCYPPGLTAEKLNENIIALKNNRVFAGPNCWGTAFHSLGLIPTLRYVSDLEFREFCNQATVLNLSSIDNIKNGSILSIWNNIYENTQDNHVALTIDAKQDIFFEKLGPDEGSPFRYNSLKGILADSNTERHIVKLVDDSKQFEKGIYAILLDLSNMKSLQSSMLEDRISLYHQEGILLNKQSLKNVMEIYQTEIPSITNVRDLSLTEGIYHLLKSMSAEMNKIRDDYMATKDRTLAKLLASHSELRAIVDNEVEHLTSQIHEYRKTLTYANPTYQKITERADYSVVLR